MPNNGTPLQPGECGLHRAEPDESCLTCIASSLDGAKEERDSLQKALKALSIQYYRAEARIAHIRALTYSYGPRTKLIIKVLDET